MDAAKQGWVIISKSMFALMAICFFTASLPAIGSGQSISDLSVQENPFQTIEDLERRLNPLLAEKGKASPLKLQSSCQDAADFRHKTPADIVLVRVPDIKGELRTARDKLKDLKAKFQNWKYKRPENAEIWRNQFEDFVYTVAGIYVDFQMGVAEVPNRTYKILKKIKVDLDEVLTSASGVNLLESITSEKDKAKIVEKILISLGKELTEEGAKDLFLAWGVARDAQEFVDRSYTLVELIKFQNDLENRLLNKIKQGEQKINNLLARIERAWSKEFFDQIYKTKQRWMSFARGFHMKSPKIPLYVSSDLIGKILPATL